MLFDGSGKAYVENILSNARKPVLYAQTFLVLAWYGRQSCGTVHLTTLLLVAIRCVLYRHCYGTEAHASQGPSRALGKALPAKASVAEDYLGEGLR